MIPAPMTRRLRELGVNPGSSQRFQSGGSLVGSSGGRAVAGVAPPGNMVTSASQHQANLTRENKDVLIEIRDLLEDQPVEIGEEVGLRLELLA